MNPEDDLHWMRLALDEAQAALDEGNLPVGAVIVHRDMLVAKGRNAIALPRPDDTRHAELVALQSAAAALSDHKYACTLYTTLEPCMMCLGAILNCAIARLVIAAPDPLVGSLALLAGAPYYARRRSGLQVTTGVMYEAAQDLLNEYVRRTGFRKHLERRT